MAAHEIGSFDNGCSRDWHELITRRTLVGGDIQRGADRGLLLLWRWIVGRRRRIRAARERQLRDAIHFLPAGDYGRVSALADFLTRQRRLQCESELLIEFLSA